jgi:hypothetical protein
MYKLQRKNIDQSSEDPAFSTNEMTCVQLVIIWKVNNSREFYIFSDLIEHDKCRLWDRDRLMKLAKWYKLYDIQHVPIEESWSMHDNTVLMKRVNITREAEYYKLDMTIYEASIKDAH